MVNSSHSYSASNSLSVDGVMVGSDIAPPYAFSVTLPINANGATLSAIAVDTNDSSAPATDVPATLTADPRTTVVGRVVDVQGNPTADAQVDLMIIEDFDGITGGDGRFTIPNVRSLQTSQAFVTATLDGQERRGRSMPVEPARGSTTAYGGHLSRLRDLDRRWRWCILERPCQLVGQHAARCDRQRLNSGGRDGYPRCGRYGNQYSRQRWRADAVG